MFRHFNPTTMDTTTDMQPIVDQFKDQIFSMAEEAVQSRPKDRFVLLHRMHNLKKIVFMMEEIDQSLESLRQ